MERKEERGVGIDGIIDGMASKGLRELSKIYQNSFFTSVFVFSLPLTFFFPSSLPLLSSPPLFPSSLPHLPTLFHSHVLRSKQNRGGRIYNTLPAHNPAWQERALKAENAEIKYGAARPAEWACGVYAMHKVW